jgi:hypothetical protein
MEKTIEIRGRLYELTPNGVGRPYVPKATFPERVEFKKHRLLAEKAQLVRNYPGPLDSEIKRAEKAVASAKIKVNDSRPQVRQNLDLYCDELLKAEAWLQALRDEDERRSFAHTDMWDAIQERRAKAAEKAQAKAAEKALRAEFEAEEAQEREKRFAEFKKRRTQTD